MEPSKRWQTFEGPIGATITTLFDIGFTPTMPQQWVIRKPDGVESTATLGLSAWRDFAIVREVSELYCVKLWRMEATTNNLCKCLEFETKPPCFIGFEKAKSRLP